jgi:hypothetical protein
MGCDVDHGRSRSHGPIIALPQTLRSLLGFFIARNSNTLRFVAGLQRIG